MATAPDTFRSSSTLILQPMLAYARKCGVDVDTLVRNLGIAPADLHDPDVRIPEATRARAWSQAAAGAGDEAFGLRVAEHAPEGAYDVLDYALCYSSTVRDGLEQIVRFHRILSDAVAMEIVVKGSSARLRRLVTGTPPPEQDCYFALLCLRMRQLTGRAIRPRHVRFAYPRHPAREHERLFRCAVDFDAPRAEMELDLVDLELPIRNAKPRLVEVLDRHAGELLSRLPSGASYVDHVRNAVTKSLRSGSPTLQAVSRVMRASPRTVQRRLREAGTTHRRVLEDVRRDLAERYLASPELSITEIAYLLGFEDESGFRRSFKRWNGRSPALSRTQR